MTRDPAIWFVVGFAFALACVFLAELGAHFIQRRRVLRRFEQLCPDPMAQVQCDPCPWPIDAKFPHRMAGVSEYAATRKSGFRAMAGGGPRIQHSKSSSRFFDGGSESST